MFNNFRNTGGWDTIAPNVQPVNQEVRPVVDIPPTGEPKKLKIVLKYSDEKYLYGWSNTSYKYPENLKDPSLKFDERVYKVHIALKGVDMEIANFNFTIYNENNDLMITDSRMPII